MLYLLRTAAAPESVSGFTRLIQGDPPNHVPGGRHDSLLFRRLVLPQKYAAHEMVNSWKVLEGEASLGT